MFVITTRLSKRMRRFGLFGAVAVIAVIALLLFVKRTPAQKMQQIESNADRVAYLEALGWEVDPEPLETLQLVLPEEIGEADAAYYELQRSQGFSLSDCAGKQVTRCTFTVRNYPDHPDGVQLNLYTCDGKVVAGDVIASGSDGFQGPLRYPGT